MAVLDGLKAVASVLREADKINEYHQILEAQQSLVDLQDQLNTEKGKTRTLESELAAVRADQENADGIQRRGDVYVLDGQRYCVHCWLVDKRLGPVVGTIKASGSNSRYPALQCTRCKQEIASSRG